VNERQFRARSYRGQAICLYLWRRIGPRITVVERVEYRILGPLEVEVGGRSLPIGGPKQRTLLAMLLLGANRVVSVARLVDAVWGEAPPTTAIAQVQGYDSSHAIANFEFETVLPLRRRSKIHHAE
jgi:hypothetical protein